MRTVTLLTALLPAGAIALPGPAGLEERQLLGNVINNAICIPYNILINTLLVDPALVPFCGSYVKLPSVTVTRAAGAPITVTSAVTLPPIGGTTISSTAVLTLPAAPPTSITVTITSTLTTFSGTTTATCLTSAYTVPARSGGRRAVDVGQRGEKSDGLIGRQFGTSLGGLLGGVTGGTAGGLVGGLNPLNPVGGTPVGGTTPQGGVKPPTAGTNPVPINPAPVNVAPAPVNQAPGVVKPPTGQAVPLAGNTAPAPAPAPVNGAPAIGTPTPGVVRPPSGQTIPLVGGVAPAPAPAPANGVPAVGTPAAVPINSGGTLGPISGGVGIGPNNGAPAPAPINVGPVSGPGGSGSGIGVTLSVPRPSGLPISIPDVSVSIICSCAPLTSTVTVGGAGASTVTATRTVSGTARGGTTTSVRTITYTAPQGNPLTVTSTVTSTFAALATNVVPNGNGLPYKQYTSPFNAYLQDSGFSANYFHAKTPNWSGIWNSLNYATPYWPSMDVAFTLQLDQPQPWDASKVALVFQGFFVAPLSGTFTFTVPSAGNDNFAELWMGPAAYAWTDQTANFKSTRGATTTSTDGVFSITMNAGDAQPFTYLWANGGDAGRSAFSILLPDGTQPTDISRLFVQACNSNVFSG